MDFDRNHFASGALEFECPLVNGVRQGVARRWYEDSALFSEAHYVNGELDGQLRQWSPDGV